MFDTQLAGFNWQTFIGSARFVACLIEEVNPIIYLGSDRCFWVDQKIFQRQPQTGFVYRDLGDNSMDSIDTISLDWLVLRLN
jgi:hypothetical protein